MKKVFIALSLLFFLILIAVFVYFLFPYLKENTTQQDRIINETQKHTACLNENEYADYPLDEKSNPIKKKFLRKYQF